MGSRGSGIITQATHNARNNCTSRVIWIYLILMCLLTSIQAQDGSRSAPSRWFARYFTTGGEAWGVAVSPEGTVFLANDWDGLRVYDYNGQSFKNIAHFAMGIIPGQLDRDLVKDLVISPNGTVFMVSSYSGIYAFRYRNNRLEKIAQTLDVISVPDKPVHFLQPYDIALGPNGTLFVSGGNDGLWSYSFDGTSFSKGDSIFTDGPVLGIAVNQDGVIFTANRHDGLHAFTYSGSAFTHTAHFTHETLGSAYKVAVGPDGTIFLVDQLHGLMAFEYDGSSFQIVGQVNQGMAPHGVDIGSDGTVFLANYMDGLRAYEFTRGQFENTAHIHDGKDYGGRTFRVKVGPDGTIFIGNADDGLRAYRYTGSAFIPAGHVRTVPWWKTRLAYGVYTILAVSFFVGLWRFQAYRLRLRYQAEYEHREAERFRELDQLKSRFFANISHEFRTPLTLILGPIEKLRTRFTDDDSLWELGLMQKNAQRLLNLVTQLLDLSKLESRSMRLQAARCNVIPMLKGIVYSFGSMADSQDITLTFEHDEEDIQFYTEQDVMVKIITNLLSNAFKFTKPGGRITVSANAQSNSEKTGPGFLHIEVTDSGIGISADRIENIFDRFYQVDSGETRVHEGAGIGLALTRELVELHKGEISVLSEENQGTTFTMRFPLGRVHLDPEEIVDQEQTEPGSVETLLPIDVEESERVPSPAASDGSLPLLLIVEDNADVRQYILGYLEQDYRCLKAENGETGLDLVLREIPDLIISDIMMPRMDGNEFCKRVKTDARTSHIPVILLTAKADLDSKLEGLETGADDYLTKPFEAQELQVRIRNLIDQRRRLQMHFSQNLEIQPAESTVNSIDERFLEKALNIIEEHLDDMDFSVAQFSQEIAMSQRHLARKLKALTDHSTQDFMRCVRLKHAALLLRNKTDNVTQIAYRVGFKNPSYFAECFRKEFGSPPSKYSDQFSA